MELVIILRRQVDTRQQGEDIFNIVKEKLEDSPSIKVTGHVTNHFETEEPES